MHRLFRLLAAAFLLAASLIANAFVHSHAAWDALLKRHVVVAADGNASAVCYAALKADAVALQAYLESLSAVSEREYWSRT